MDSLTLLYDCKTKVLQRFFIAKNNKQKHRFLHVPRVQANLWTEYMSALDEMEYMLYPRVAALSEVAWSKKEHKDYGKFCTRLESIRQHYDVLGINYCKKISNE